MGPSRPSPAHAPGVESSVCTWLEGSPSMASRGRQGTAQYKQIVDSAMCRWYWKPLEQVRAVGRIPCDRA